MARSAREGLWQERISAQARSGLSALAYCDQEGVSPQSFYAWRRRFQLAKPNQQPPLFVPVELAAVSSSPGELRIELPGGVALVLRGDASQERLVIPLPCR